MGATDPLQMEPHARELAGQLKQDEVDAVILSPVRPLCTRAVSESGQTGGSVRDAAETSR
jgi:hypothetical protein